MIQIRFIQLWNDVKRNIDIIFIYHMHQFSDDQN